MVYNLLVIRFYFFFGLLFGFFLDVCVDINEIYWYDEK